MQADECYYALGLVVHNVQHRCFMKVVLFIQHLL